MISHVCELSVTVGDFTMDGVQDFITYSPAAGLATVRLADSRSLMLADDDSQLYSGTATGVFLSTGISTWGFPLTPGNVQIS